MIERWLKEIRDHPTRPPMAQCHVLTMLALRMDWHTGSGFASTHQLQADSSASKATILRATKWARDASLLIQVKRGHRINAERRAASVWQLTQGLTPETLANPRCQNGRPKVSIEQAKVSAETHYQEPVVLQESYPSARAPAQRGAAALCPSCNRLPHTGHLPGCPEDRQP
jgi:hypothetical protein